MALNGDQGTGAGGSGDLVVSEESLAALRKRVGEVLRELQGSSAADSNVRQQVIGRDAYSGPGLSVADELSKQYDRSRTELERFTRIFGEQIEALSLVIQMSEKGFANVEAEQRARFHQLQENANRYYKAPEPRPDDRDVQAEATDKDITY